MSTRSIGRAYLITKYYKKPILGNSFIIKCFVFVNECLEATLENTLLQYNKLNICSMPEIPSQKVVVR